MQTFKIGDKVKLEEWNEYLPIIGVKQFDILVREDDDVAWYNTKSLKFIKEQDMQNTQASSTQTDSNQADQADQHAFQAGDTVWCVIYGEGKVTAVDAYGEYYPVNVRFPGDNNQCYTRDGKFHIESNRCLYFSEPKVEASVTRPFVSKLIGKKVLVVSSTAVQIKTIFAENSKSLSFTPFGDFVDKQDILAIYEVASENLLSN